MDRQRIFAALLVSLWYGPAQAATFFVAPTGNDANAGAQASPWRTLAKAASTMVAGDTTLVGEF